MDKLKMQTSDSVQNNIDLIAQLFPECVTEGFECEGKKVIDFDKLRQLLSDDIVEGNEERYQFTWPDKRKAILLANTPINATLRPCREESVNFDKTQNLYIEGDNLDVLKCLKETYLHKVKMIYIDPPYNRGKDSIYKDKFKTSTSDYLVSSGQIDEDGNRLSLNLESNGRFHTDWLNMIYPRLKVARDLLTDDGVIFISIDDHEVERLRLICNEIFGEKNFVAQLIWEQGRKSMAVQVAVNHEYCLVWCKDKKSSILYDNLHNNMNWREKKKGLDDIYKELERLKSIHGTNYGEIEKEMRNFYNGLPEGNFAKKNSQYRYVDKNGLYFPGDIAQGTGNGGRFDIIHPITGKPCKLPSGGWRFSKDSLPNLLKNDKIHFGKDETTIPCLKRYLKETEYEVPSSVFYKDGRGASMRLEKLMGDEIFIFPKDEDVIKTFITYATTYSNTSNIDIPIILDFFSGSGTTAHAMMTCNAHDGGKRKFIMVQLPEDLNVSLKNCTEKSEQKIIENAIKFCKSQGLPENLCEVAKERIRRAGKKIKEEMPLITQDLDIGFRVLKLDSTNMRDIYYSPAKTNQKDIFGMVDNVKEDRTSEDLLFQVMLELGATLDSKIEVIKEEGKTIYNVANNYLVACFDEKVNDNVVTKMAKMLPEYAILRDASVESDSVVTNFEQIFKTYSPNTTIKIL